MSVPEDRVQTLLEQGVEIPDDPAEIERLLDSDVVDDSEQDDDAAAAKTAEELAAEQAAGKKDDEVVVDKDATGKDKPGEGEDVTTEPPAAVLRVTRQSLHDTSELLKERETELQDKNDRIDKLEGRIAQLTTSSEAGQQDLQKTADELAGDIDLEELTDERIAEIREEAGDEAADLLTGLLTKHKALGERLVKLEAASETATQEREAVDAAQLQTDIDTIPLLSVMHAQRGEQADANWARAVNYERALRADPDWAEKTRGEIYAEVGKRMTGHLGEKAVKTLLGDTVITETDDAKAKVEADKSAQDKIDEALKAADEAAVPTSLSDLPAGQAAAQSELERAGAMSIADAEAAIVSALDKGGTDEVNVTLDRLLTMEPST